MNILPDLFLTFFKIGLFTFGGGYAMLPMIRQEVLAHGWMSLEDLINFIAVSESTPGPFAINVSTYIGTETAGFLGAVAATSGVVLPSFIVILIVAQGYEKFRDSKIVQGVMSGLRPAVIGLIAAALFSVAKTVFIPHNGEIQVLPTLFSLAVVGIAAFLRLKKKVHPILVILLSALLGIAAGYAGILNI